MITSISQVVSAKWAIKPRLEGIGRRRRGRKIQQKTLPDFFS